MASKTPAPRPRRLFILGGTGEAAALAAAASSRFGGVLEVVTSLAGRSLSPVAVAGQVRIGGFGGPEGLADYLREAAIDLVIDATHPFARRISAHAGMACAAAAVPRLHLVRPPWRRTARDRWIEVADMAAAARAVARTGRRVFLTVGTGPLGAFADLTDIWFLIRVISAPAAPLPLGRPGRDFELVIGRGPFSVAAERRLMTGHGIDAVVSRNSGSAATKAKIVAARQLGVPVVMLRRPPPLPPLPPGAPGARASSVAAALDWLTDRLNRLDGTAPQAP